ncbi:MAG: hypothetical protein GX444_12350 [Myxococcales bacterium]|nr:hypothetical protein [Myxococcales bacterium]
MRNERQQREIAVIGAGPAGAHLARRLAETGLRVWLFDPRAPWEKPCGGGITHQAWSRFPILRAASLKPHEVFQSLQISPHRQFFVVDQGHPLLMVSRRALGEVMLDAATRAGAVHVPAAVERLESSAGRIRLTAGGREYLADFVAGADGVRSLVRRTFLGELAKERTLGAICRFYEGGPGDPTVVRVASFPGYCWSFPRADCLAVGVGAMQRGYDIKGALEGFMADFYPGRRPLGPAQGALLPYLHDFGAYREPRVGACWALIGDAAGFVDTLTGEGIGYAVWSADLLADAILAGRPGRYEGAWRRAFGWHLMSGAWVARHIFNPKFIDRFFTAITVCPALRRTFMDYVWNLPPYPVLLGRALRALPATRREWRAFKRDGALIPAERLQPFESLAGQIDFQYRP